ncbi:hypothetical protein CDCA_CDCA09G2697 [Cyanidium caldarium]|uniref:DNA-directed RNA polymerase RBP11-like dimerisation domain-containing protein n=1 Tax=Cyanidium caldarium TaxID=2771 RepID=A0AAV9IWG0_CYACA|nr:hypothetical protein CDCA_CDCA09G2697 [Cyanidium caldarium]
MTQEPSVRASAGCAVPRTPIDGASDRPPPTVHIEQSADACQVTLTLENEGHTLGNVLRYMIARDPRVEHAGYSVPHPSENRVKVNVITRPGTRALDVVQSALANVALLCDELSGRYEAAASGGTSSTCP